MEQDEHREWPTSGHRLIDEIIKASARLTKAADRFLDPWGITSAQFDLLGVLALHPAGLMQAEAGVFLGVTRANVTGLVRRLAARGLCSVDDKLGDSRARMVRTTPAGISLLARLESPWAARIRHTTRDISGPLQVRFANAAVGLEPHRRATPR